jgi:hypothetical protein
MQLIRLQNETIGLMEKELIKLATKAVSSIPSETLDLIHKNQRENSQILSQSSAVKVSQQSMSAIIDDYRVIDTSDMEKDCEERFGLTLVSKWRENRQVWCEDKSHYKDKFSSELVCYRYHQHHKKREGQGLDMFCVATNFVVDFSKVSRSLGSMIQLSFN